MGWLEIMTKLNQHLSNYHCIMYSDIKFYIWICPALFLNSKFSFKTKPLPFRLYGSTTWWILIIEQKFLNQNLKSNSDNSQIAWTNSNLIQARGLCFYERDF